MTDLINVSSTEAWTTAAADTAVEAEAGATRLLVVHRPVMAATKAQEASQRLVQQDRRPVQTPSAYFMVLANIAYIQTRLTICARLSSYPPLTGATDGDRVRSTLSGYSAA